MIDAILIGGGGHAKSVADTVKTLGLYNIIGIVTKDKEDWNEFKWLGGDDKLQSIYEAGITTAIMAIGYLGEGKTRRVVFDSLKEIGFTIPAIVDSTAIVSSDTVIGEGTFIGKGVIVNAGSSIGKATIINTGAIIEHECRIGDFSHIAVGTRLCGRVNVGEDAFIGAGATVIQCINVGNGVKVGAGSAVISDIEDGVTAVGIPSKVLRKKI